MDIPKREFIRHAIMASKRSSRIKVGRKAWGADGYQTGSFEDQIKRLEQQSQRATIWTITNTNTGQSVDVEDTDELMEAAEAMTHCKALNLPAPDILSKPAPSPRLEAFLAHLRANGVKDEFEEKNARYKLTKKGIERGKLGWFRSRGAYLLAPRNEGDPEFDERFLNDAIRVCQELKIDLPESMRDDDARYEAARLRDELVARGRRVELEEVTDAGSQEPRYRIWDASDDTIEPIVVRAFPDNSGSINSEDLVSVFNGLMEPLPDDAPDTLSISWVLERVDSRSRLLTDGISAAQREVDMDNDDTEIVEHLADLVEDHSDARSDGKSLSQEKLREAKEKEEEDKDKDKDDKGKGEREHEGRGHGH